MISGAGLSLELDTDKLPCGKFEGGELLAPVSALGGIYIEGV